MSEICFEVCQRNQGPCEISFEDIEQLACVRCVSNVRQNIMFGSRQSNCDKSEGGIAE